MAPWSYCASSISEFFAASSEHISVFLAEKKGKDGYGVSSGQYLHTVFQVPHIWIVIDIYA